MRFAILLLVAMAHGCNSKESAATARPTQAAKGPPAKVTANELYDAYKIDSRYDGKTVEVTGFVRSAEVDRSAGKVVLDGGYKPLDLIEVFFTGPISGIKRGQTATITATVKGKVGNELVLTDAKLVAVKYRPKN